MERIKDQVEFALFSRSPTVDLFVKNGFGVIEGYYSINNNLKIVTLLTIGWMVVFGFVSFFYKKRSWEVKNLAVSLIHSLLAVIVCSWALLNDSMLFNSDNTPYSSFALQLSFSYFLYDYILSSLGGSLEKSMYLHHIISLGALGHGLFTGRSGTELIQSLLLLESSNPFFHLRAILVQVNENKFASFIIGLEAFFVITFFICRIAYGCVLVYKLFLSSTLVLVVFGVGMYALSLFWFGVIMQKAYDKFIAPKKADPAKKKD